MSELNLNETTLDLYDNFSKNALNEHDSAVFKNRLNQDPEFNAGYQTFLLSKAVIDEKIALNLREQMQLWKGQTSTSEKTEHHKIITLPQPPISERRITWTKWIAAASVMFVLVVGFEQYSFYHEYTDQLLNNHVALKRVATRSEPSPPSRINIEKIIQSLGENPKTDAIENAISELSKGNTMDSNYMQAQVQIGRLYTHLGNWSMAEKAYLNGDAPKPLMEISEILTMMKTKESKSKEFQEKLNRALHDSDDTNDDIIKEIQSKTNTFWWKLYN